MPHQWGSQSQSGVTATTQKLIIFTSVLFFLYHRNLHTIKIFDLLMTDTADWHQAEEPWNKLFPVIVYITAAINSHSLISLSFKVNKTKTLLMMLQRKHNDFCPDDSTVAENLLAGDSFHKFVLIESFTISMIICIFDNSFFLSVYY